MLLFFSRISIMVTGKRLADIGYRAFSGSMMLLTLYGGFLCTLRAYNFFQKQKHLKVAAENQNPELVKDWRHMDLNTLLFCTKVDIFSISLSCIPKLGRFVWEYVSTSWKGFCVFASNMFSLRKPPEIIIWTKNKNVSNLCNDKHWLRSWL